MKIVKKEDENLLSQIDFVVSSFVVLTHGEKISDKLIVAGIGR